MTDLETAARAALTAMKQAREDTESWAEYASDYFKDKHGLAGDLARQDAAIAALEAALAASDNRVREAAEDILYHVDGGRAAIRRAALEEAARVAELAPHRRGGMICGCSEGLADWTAAAIRALAEKEPDA